jgi:hypothetical protein
LLEVRLVAGARDGGAIEVDVYADELSGLRGGSCVRDAAT